MTRCKECYSEKSRATPLLNPADCLKSHEQYICGTCGRCICIGADERRGLRRWQFPFKTRDIALLYLRTAEASAHKPCGIYEIRDKRGRASFKIFPSREELRAYLDKNPGKTCPGLRPVFQNQAYNTWPNTQVRRLSPGEAERYLAQQEEKDRK